MMALPSRKAPSSATDMISRHSSNDMSRNEVWRRRPALLTRMSTPPKALAARSASLGGTCGSETSPMAATALPPAAVISPTTESTAALSARPLTTTAAPSRARVRAMARPILRPAPVTRATLPCRAASDGMATNCQPIRCQSTRGPSRRSAGDDVGFERLGLGPGLFQPRLDDVADRDQAQQLAAMHHRQVAEAPVGHGLHDLVDRIVGIAGDDIARHHLARLELERPGAVRRGGANEIALRDDAHHRALVAQYQDRADAPAAELLRDLGDRCGRSHRINQAALLRENVGDEHGSPSA